MSDIHRYSITVRWTGNRGRGTSGYRDYSRAHVVQAAGKPHIAGSSDPAFRGHTDRWNPEEMMVAALSQCHMLWYLHLASSAGVVVTDYVDEAIGALALDVDGSGQFKEVVLRPRVTVSELAMVERAHALHADASANCFIARSVNFLVRHEPDVLVGI